MGFRLRASDRGTFADLVGPHGCRVRFRGRGRLRGEHLDDDDDLGVQRGHRCGDT